MLFLLTELLSKSTSAKTQTATHSVGIQTTNLQQFDQVCVWAQL